MTPMPDLPLARMASSAGIARMSSSCFMHRSRFALGRSILLMTGMILSLLRHGQVGVGDRLRLDTLGRVDQQHGPLARREGARDLVREVHVAGRVHEVQLCSSGRPWPS